MSTTTTVSTIGRIRVHRVEGVDLDSAAPQGPDIAVGTDDRIVLAAKTSSGAWTTAVVTLEASPLDDAAAPWSALPAPEGAAFADDAGAQPLTAGDPARLAAPGAVTGLTTRTMRRLRLRVTTTEGSAATATVWVIVHPPREPAQ